MTKSELIMQVSKSTGVDSNNVRAVIGCFRPIKDTILKANHNLRLLFISVESGVSDLSKIQF